MAKRAIKGNFQIQVPKNGVLPLKGSNMTIKKIKSNAGFLAGQTILPVVYPGAVTGIK